VPPLVLWSSILVDDAIEHCKTAAETFRTSKNTAASNISFGTDGTLKDQSSIKDSISAESSKFFMRLPTKISTLSQHDEEFRDFAKNIKRIKMIQGNRGTDPGSEPDLEPLNRRRSMPEMKGNDLIQLQRLAQAYPKRPKVFTREESISHLAARKFNYNDPDLAFQLTPTGPIIMGGTKEKLLLLLTTISIIKKRFILEFLSVYPYFATCEEVCDSLWNAYFDTKVPEGITEDAKPYINRVKKRVVYILTLWIQYHPKQFFAGKCIQKLGDFIEKLEDTPEKSQLLQRYEEVSILFL